MPLDANVASNMPYFYETIYIAPSNEQASANRMKLRPSFQL